MQIVTDLAHGLDYMHHDSGLDSTFVHNHIKSSSFIISKEDHLVLDAKVCHFGTAELYDWTQARLTKLKGTRSYMAPEFEEQGEHCGFGEDRKGKKRVGLGKTGSRFGFRVGPPCKKKFNDFILVF
ncbi:hypothetical protein PS2_009347 [Malus domestica]